MKILLRNLTKRFPDRNKKTRGEITAVNDLTLEIPDGKLVGLLGPSGCGKSTTLNLICGLEKSHGRNHFLRRPGCDCLRAGTPGRGHGVPELRPVSSPDGPPEHPVSIGKFKGKR